MEIALKVFLAVVIGGMVGAEREYRDKAAGFRTILLITLGSTLFTMVSQDLAGEGNDPARVAAGIVSGVGFLGGGVIFRNRGTVSGITTAATIWVAAALGMGIGAGAYALTISAFVVMMAVLIGLPKAEILIERQSELLTYRIVTTSGQSKLDQLRNQFQDLGLSVRSFKEAKNRDEMITYFSVSGRQDAHRSIMKLLYEDPDVVEFET